MSNRLLEKLNIRLKNVHIPQDCFLCGVAGQRAILCGACEDNLPRLPSACCPVCSLPTLDGLICGRCLKKAPAFDDSVAAFDYGFPVDVLIRQFKYSHQLALGPWLAERLLVRLSGMPLPKAALAMPLSRARLHERGFNQSLEIAKPLCRALGLPLLPHACERIRDTESQTTLPWKERAQNVRGAFACREDLAGKHIAIIDDVMTTGASVNELAKTLKKSGAARVSAWVIARTRLESFQLGTF